MRLKRLNARTLNNFNTQWEKYLNNIWNYYQFVCYLRVDNKETIKILYRIQHIIKLMEELNYTELKWKYSLTCLDKEKTYLFLCEPITK